jgi:hypothetical protein
MPTNKVWLKHACVQLLALWLCALGTAFTCFSCLALIVKKDALGLLSTLSVRPSPVCCKHSGQSGRKRGVRPHDILLPCLLVIYLQWEIQWNVTEWRVHSASQRRRLKQAHVQVPSVDKCENGDSVIPTTCNQNSGYMISRPTHVVRETVRRPKVVLACLPQKQERMSCAIWRRIVWQNCTAASEAPTVSIIRSTLMLEPAGLLLPDNTVSTPPPQKNKLIFKVTTVRTSDLAHYKIYTTCPSLQFFLDSITLIIYGEQDRSWSSSLHTSLHPRATSPPHSPQHPFPKQPPSVLMQAVIFLRPSKQLVK